MKPKIKYTYLQLHQLTVALSFYCNTFRLLNENAENILVYIIILKLKDRLQQKLSSKKKQYSIVYTADESFAFIILVKNKTLCTSNIFINTVITETYTIIQDTFTNFKHTLRSYSNDLMLLSK